MGLVLLLFLVCCSVQETNQSSFVVGIAYRFDASLSPFCAGALVADRWVVTSASCVSSDRNVIKKRKLVVGFGADGRQDVSRVEKVIKHKDYSQDKGGSTVQGNIALLKLVSKIDNTRYRSACVPTKEKSKKMIGKARATFWDNLPAQNDKSFKSKVTFKYKKKKKKAANQRKDLRLLGWRLNPFLPGALSDKLEEKAVIKR